MTDEKLIETRGEAPAFLPGHVGESWQRVDFGLGASSMQSSPEVEAALPPRQRAAAGAGRGQDRGKKVLDNHFINHG